MSESPVTPPSIFPLKNLTSFLVPPDIRALFNGLKAEIYAALNCHQIAVVQAVNANQTVTVQLVLQRAVYNNPPTSGVVVQTQPRIVAYPILVDVPFQVISGGGAYIAMPIAAGDVALVLFNDRDLDPWLTFGTFPNPPNSLRTHSLSDGLALVGFRSNINPIAVPTDGQHISIGNESGTFRVAMDALFNALISAVISGTTFNAATITAITNAKTAFDNIFE